MKAKRSFVLKPRARVVEFDILRAFAIIMILFAHSYSYLPTVKLNSVVAFFISFAFALFLFHIRVCFVPQ